MAYMISEGAHTAVARSFELGETSKGNQQIAVLFEIVEGVDQGCTIVWYGHFTDKTTDRTMESLRYCGWTCNDVTVLTGLGSKLVQIVVEHETQQEGKHEGQQRARVRWVNRLGGGAIKLEKPMDANAKRMFAAKMAMHAKKAPVMQGGIGPQDRSPTEKPSEGEDDIPF